MNNPAISILKTAGLGQPARASRLLAALAGSALLLGATLSSGWAASLTWNGTSGATWDTTGTNWNPSTGTPWDSTNGILNTGNFTGSGNATVSGTVYAQKINYTLGSGSFTLSGGTINQGSSAALRAISVATGGELIVQSPLAYTINTPSANASTFLGRLILDANNSSMIGAAGNYFSSGHVILRNNNALGPNGTITNVYGATNGSNSANVTMELQGGITVNSGLVVEGRGIGALGVLRVTDGTTNTWSGTVTLKNAYVSTAVRIGVDGATSRLNIIGNIVNGTGAAQIVEKTGNGTLNLTGNNTYTAGTTVSVGTLLVNNTLGSGTGTGSVTVDAGARLGGNGTISGATTINGTLAPGNSIGTITTGNLTLTSTSAMDVELGRSGVTPVSDRTNVNGTVSLTSGADLKLTLFGGLNTPVLNDIFFLINNDSTDAITGAFTKLNGGNQTLSEGSQFSWNSLNWQITYTANVTASSFTGGNDLALQVIPEPTTWALLAVSLTTIMVLRRRRRS